MPNVSKICNKKKRISHSIKYIYISRIKITKQNNIKAHDRLSVNVRKVEGERRPISGRDSDESFSVPGKGERGDGKENEAEAQETKVFGHVCSGTAATRVTDNNGGLSTSHQSQTATPSTYAARTVRAVAYVQA